MKKRTAIIALVGVGVLVGIAVGLGVGLSSRSSGSSDGATIESSSVAGISNSAINRGTGASQVDVEDTSGTPESPVDATSNATGDTVESKTNSTGSEPCPAGDSSCKNGTIVEPLVAGNATDLADSTKPPQEPDPDADLSDPHMTTTKECHSILEIARETPELSAIVAAVQLLGGYTDILEDPISNVTVLAPSNAAFAKIPDEESQALLSDDGNLTQVLALHIIPDVVTRKELSNGAKFSTFADDSLRVVEGGSNIRLSAGGATARVINADIFSCSGVVHIIDTVLVAPDMYADDTSETDTGDERAEPQEPMDPIEPEEIAPPPPPPAQDPQPGPDKKWTVCIGSYGKMSSDDACGVRVSRNGKVTVGEYFGGFDGFFSFNPADSHENCFNRAVVRAFGLNICGYSVIPAPADSDAEEEEAGPGTEIVCKEPEDGSMCACAANRYGEPAIWEQRRNWPGNKGVIEFLKQLRLRANPVDFEYPRDQELADSGGRVENQRKVEEAFTAMVNVREC